MASNANYFALLIFLLSIYAYATVIIGEFAFMEQLEDMGNLHSEQVSC